ncbi:hypothetical protein ACQQ2N_12315 [Dokdonella sp. MW10]|uniref:hypothetical protein n=1 Tax=Dokdonella sp. MW10 TaxID=2992926 RepID=UPI003F7DFAE0
MQALQLTGDGPSFGTPIERARAALNKLPRDPGMLPVNDPWRLLHEICSDNGVVSGIEEELAGETKEREYSDQAASAAEDMADRYRDQLLDIAAAMDLKGDVQRDVEHGTFAKRAITRLEAMKAENQ